MMKIHVLIEDIPREGYDTEHGLSLMITYNGKQVLLDTGTTDAFLKNAEKMSVNVSEVEYSILSHGHYDHSGGYAAYLAQNPNVMVYAMESAAGEYYSGNGGTIHYAGIPKTVFPTYEKQFKFVNAVTSVSDGIWLIPHSTTGLEKRGARALLYKKSGDEYLPDDFAHELSLVFETEKGLVIYNSCSHGGVETIIEEVKAALPKKQIYAFVGGLHMKGKRDGQEICIYSEEEVGSMATYLMNEGVEKLYTGHCTGNVAYQMLKKYLGDHMIKLNTGDVVEL